MAGFAAGLEFVFFSRLGYFGVVCPSYEVGSQSAYRGILIDIVTATGDGPEWVRE